MQETWVRSLGWEDPPGEGKGYPLQYSGLENFYFCFIDYAKAFNCVDHNKLWKILREMGIPPPNLPLEKSVCRSGSNS